MANQLTARRLLAGRGSIGAAGARRRPHDEPWEQRDLRGRHGQPADRAPPVGRARRHRRTASAWRTQAHMCPARPRRCPARERPARRTATAAHRGRAFLKRASLTRARRARVPRPRRRFYFDIATHPPERDRRGAAMRANEASSSAHCAARGIYGRPAAAKPSVGPPPLRCRGRGVAPRSCSLAASTMTLTNINYANMR